MRIAFASGKGGTGKTTIATNLAAVLAETGRDVTYLDCDVEEPNGQLFLKPNETTETSAGVPVPHVDLDRCTFCGKCADFCRFNALAMASDKVLHFPELCHSCGGCALVCPEDAITERTREIGTVTTGQRATLEVVEGRLNIGELQAPPLIAQVKEQSGADVVIIDAPPGTACPALEAVSDIDFVVLVAEPTPFGANDMSLAMDMLDQVDLPYAVVINREGIGTNEVCTICRDRKVDILVTVPDQRRIAELCAQGELFVDHLPEYRERFTELFEKVSARIEQ